MLDDSKQYCEDVLPLVSRTFALGIQALDDPLDMQICVGYLICRILDALEDTNKADTEKRMQLLQRAATELCDISQRNALIEDMKQVLPTEIYDGNDIQLVHETAKVMEVFDSFPENIQTSIKTCVKNMANGMAKTVAREENHQIHGLKDYDDLAQYCYYVAGTVGELLTEVFASSRSSITPNIKEELKKREISFALGLQLTNILKGIVDDYARGVMYLPLSLLKKYNIEREHFLEKPLLPQYKDMVYDMIEYILPYMDKAIEYTLLIPEEETDIRIFCALPVLFGLRTLKLAKSEPIALLEGTPLKITRKEVKELHIQADKAIDDNKALQKLFMLERAF